MFGSVGEHRETRGSIVIRLGHWESPQASPDLPLMLPWHIPTFQIKGLGARVQPTHHSSQARAGSIDSTLQDVAASMHRGRGVEAESAAIWKWEKDF